MRWAGCVVLVAQSENGYMYVGRREGKDYWEYLGIDVRNIPLIPGCSSGRKFSFIPENTTVAMSTTWFNLKKKKKIFQQNVCSL
jgi:hypothetical protein